MRNWGVYLLQATAYLFHAIRDCKTAVQDAVNASMISQGFRLQSVEKVLHMQAEFGIGFE